MSDAITTTTVSLPRLNESAPQFQAIATSGPIKLSDYKGKWVVLFFHPVDEILRLIDALQLNSEKGLATPANWKPGDKVIVPAPLTQDAIEKRLKEPGVEVKDWYLTYKQP